MKAQELLIGDFVFSKGKDIHTVQGLDEDENGRWWYYSPEHQAWCAVDEAQPIPLTPEILEKNGFEKNSANYYRIVINKKLAGDGFEMQEISVSEKNLLLIFTSTCDVRINIKHVHELQHVLRLCGIDKEIIL